MNYGKRLIAPIGKRFSTRSGIFRIARAIRHLLARALPCSFPGTDGAKCSYRILPAPQRTRNLSATPLLAIGSTPAPRQQAAGCQGPPRRREGRVCIEPFFSRPKETPCGHGWQASPFGNWAGCNPVTATRVLQTLRRRSPPGAFEKRQELYVCGDFTASALSRTPMSWRLLLSPFSVPAMPQT